MPVDRETQEFIASQIESQTVALTELINSLKRQNTASNERCELLTKENILLKQQLVEARVEIDSLRDAVVTNRKLAIDELATHKAESAAAIRAAVAASDAKLNGVKIALDDLEQYGRRKSIRVQNVPLVAGEDKDKSQDLLLASINATIQPSGIVLNHKDIIRFHRSSAAKDNRDVEGGKVSQCIVKVKNWKLRQQFQGLNTAMRLKERGGGAGCRVYHDLTKRRLSLLNEARDLCKEGWFAYADLNSNLKLRKGERFLKFNTSEELHKHIANLGFQQIPEDEPVAEPAPVELSA